MNCWREIFGIELGKSFSDENGNAGPVKILYKLYNCFDGVM